MLDSVMKSLIGHSIVAAGRAIKVFNLKMFTKNNFEITPEQFVVLSMLNEDTLLHQSKLCKELYKDKSNMTRILTILEKQGLLKRIQTTENNKVVNKIQITQKGKMLKKKILPFMEKSRCTYLKDITTDEMYTCIKVLTKIQENLAENN